MTANQTEITDARIAQLRTEAAEHGDHAMALIADIALGRVVLDDDTTIESLRVSAFIDADDRRRIAERFGDAASARAEAVRVIRESEAENAAEKAEAQS